MPIYNKNVVTSQKYQLKNHPNCQVVDLVHTL